MKKNRYIQVSQIVEVKELINDKYKVIDKYGKEQIVTKEELDRYFIYLEE